MPRRPNRPACVEIILIAKSEAGLTQVFDGDVIAGSVDVLPIDVRYAFAVADHVTADHVAFFRRQPGHHH